MNISFNSLLDPIVSMTILCIGLVVYIIILDEAHYVQNAQAQRTKLVNNICKKIDRLWLLTGTPMTSRPMNYFNLLHLIDRQ